jgi:4,5-dihydroxyphthalate decarboxylase
MAATQTLELTIPSMTYDIMRPILEGRVPIEGVSLKIGQAPVMVYKDEPTLREGNFGLADLNLGYWPQAIEAGWELTALPVFSKRKGAYQFIFIRTDRGINSPKDLEGKRVAARSYGTSLTIWARGFLQHRFGVDITKMKWVDWVDDFFPVYPMADGKPPAPERFGDSKQSVVDALLDGDVDALISDISDGQAIQALKKSPNVRRLFPNYPEEDFKLYQETGFYTAVHLMVMSKKLDRERPELARQLYQAFEKSKEIAYTDILNDRAGFGVLYLREHMEEQVEKWGDPFKQGVKANQTMVDTYIQYNVEQGHIRERLSNQQLFAATTLDT